MAEPGDRIESHVIERRLGAGGMGEVFLAFDEKLERRVALKLLPGDRALDRSARLRMLREARAASALQHPGIVTIFDVEETEGITYIVMEYVDGETLAELVARRGRLPPDEAIGLVEQAAEAIDAAHRAGVLHRDIKSANLMVTKDGVLKVLDFGLSKRTGAASATPALAGVTPTPEDDEPVDPSAETATPAAFAEAHSADVVTVYGARMGTPGWAALELIDGEPASARSDVFSLGVVLYHLITGEPPFGGATWEQLKRQQREGRFPPASGTGAVDERFDRVIARALAARPDDRWPSCVAMTHAARLAIAPRRSWRGPAIAVMVAALGAGAIWLATRGGADRPGVFAVGPLTSSGGCADAPTFLPDGSIVFGLAVGDGAFDLYRLRPGGAPEQLTSAPTQEWRPSPGVSPGEIVYIDRDDHDDTRSRVAALDLATGATRTIAATPSPGVAAAGGAYYYVAKNRTEIRRVTAERDELAFTLPDQTVAQLLTASHDGRWLAAAGRAEGIGSRLCLIELATGKVTCPELPHVLNSRPAFAPDDASLYYPSIDGIRRHWLDGSERDELIAAGVRMPGGLTVSPAGTIVYSACEPHGPLRDVSTDPPTALGTDDLQVAAPMADAAGDVAYTRGRTVVVRRANGFVREVSGLPPDTVVTLPRLSPDGSLVAVAVAGHGIEVLAVDRDVPANRVTDNAGDGDPVWLSGDELLFDRTEDGQPRGYRVKLDGTPARRAYDADRQVLAVGGPSEGALLASADSSRLFWWDPASGAERPGPTLPIGDDELFGAALSPDGRWLVVQRGRHGDTVWRQSLDEHGAAVGAAVQVWSKPEAATVSSATITSDGHVVLVVYEWKGELVGVSEK